MSGFYRFHSNDEFIADINNLDLKNKEIMDKWTTSSSLVGFYRKKYNICKPKYKNIAIGKTASFEADLFELTIPAIMQKWEVGSYTILRARKELGLTKNNSRGKSHLHKDEYIEDLANPMLKHKSIADKWNVSISTVCRNRKHLGYGFWPQQARSSLEETFSELLNELNLAFIEQKKIGPFVPDFYLGHNICIDIHGAYIHSLEESISRDKRKVEWMSANNYLYFVFWEKDLLFPERIKEEILKIYLTRVDEITCNWVALRSNAYKE